MAIDAAWSDGETFNGAFFSALVALANTNESAAATAQSAAATAQSAASARCLPAGDLGGTATAPVVARINGVAVTGTPTVGQVLTALSAVTANWQAPAGGGGGYTDEQVRDVIGAALVQSGLISINVSDAGDTITISTTATANATDAQLRDRATHTGVQAISTVTNLQTTLDAKIPQSLVDAKGDFLTGTADNVIARMPVGSDGTVPIADSTQSLGWRWGVGTGTADNSITNAKMADDAVGVPELAATGTASATTVLAGTGSTGAWITIADAPRFLTFSGTWPARPNDDRRTFFLGGATASNAPVDANLRTFDVWIPAS